MARPVIYKEPRKAITIYIDKLLADKLDEKAKKSNISRIEFINALIVQGDKERALVLAKSFSDLQKLVSELKKSNKDCERKLESVIGKNIHEAIYANVEPDVMAKKAFENIKEKNRNSFQKFIKLRDEEELPEKIKDYWIEKVFSEMEILAVAEGKPIKNATLPKLMIKVLLLKKENERLIN